MKRVLSVILASLLVLSTLAGCTGSSNSSAASSSASSATSSATSSKTESSAATSSAESSSAPAPDPGFEHDPNLSEPGVQPICKEPITLSIGLSQSATVEDYDTNYYTGLLEEGLNGDIVYHLYPAADAATKIELLFAGGGAELPDILVNNLNNAKVLEYADAEMLIPLDDYYANSSYYFANGFKRVLETENIDLYGQITMMDGHIYTVPAYFESTTNPQYGRTWLYGPWMDELELDMPNTTEDYKNILIAFRDQDPNGNGQKDELPAFCAKLSEGFGGALFDFLMSSWTPINKGAAFINYVNGELYAAYTKDEFKEGVKYMADLVAEGLIDTTCFSTDVDTFKTIMNSEENHLVGSFTYSSDSFLTSTNPAKNHWYLCEPLEGPTGERHASYNPDVCSNRMFITMNCETPEAAFRLCDYCGDDLITITARWGKEGENWEYCDKLNNADYDNASDWATTTFKGFPPLFYQIKNIWNQQQNNHIQNALACFRTGEVAGGYYAAIIKEPSTDYQIGMHVGAYEEVMNEFPLTKYSFRFADADEEAEIIELENDLTSYVYEQMALWMTAQQDIDSTWDSFQNTLKSMGYEKYIEAKKAAFERANG